MRRISQIVLATSATSAILLLGAAAAQAGTGLQSYNTTIGKFGGAAYSGVQTKFTDGFQWVNVQVTGSWASN